VVGAVLLAAIGTLSVPVTAGVIDLASIKPQCDKPFEFDKEKKACRFSNSEADKLEESACTDKKGVQWNATSKKCVEVAGEAPEPNCGQALAGLKLKDGACMVDTTSSTGSAGDYVGDCFKVVALPVAGSSSAIKPGRYLVQFQSGEPNGPTLNLVEAERRWGIPYTCQAKAVPMVQVRAAELEEIGAERMGWTYGFLTMPFKYYPKDKELRPGGALGAYLGRRSGVAGSAITFAGAATIGGVQADSADDSGSTPTLMAVSIAMGALFDVSKTPSARPFKIGLFVGKDFVSQNEASSYALNGKPWVAFQIGFDFTDH
jgi:hypothetical protein